MPRWKNPKLQQTKRKNGSIFTYVTLPKEVVRESDLKKGDSLEVKSEGEGRVSITRTEQAEEEH